MFIIIALITFHLLSNFSFRLPFWPVLSDSLSQMFPNCNTYFGDYQFHLLQTDFFLLDGCRPPHPQKKIKATNYSLIKPYKETLKDKLLFSGLRKVQYSSRF